MECPQCGLTNAPGSSLCTACATPLPLGDQTLPFTPTPASFSGAGAIESDRTLDTGSGQPSQPAFDRTMDAMSGWSAPAAAGATAPTSTSALQPGRVLGNRYEIIQMLGEGGMGAVYKARDRELDRFVALKVIRPEFAQNADILHRFKQELILARQVTHRNVIRIFDLGEADGIKFITMEYVDGRDLKSILRESGKLEPKRAAEIIDQVCRALEVAHMEGVVHRDLKPQNIMIDKQGKASVMDFGIARTMESGGGGMTQTGALVGTPEYMSPEQAKGEKVDGRTDLFALGIIFYELLTGDSPYKAETTMASLYKRTKEIPPPPVEKDSSIPKPLSNIVVHCLQIDREKRYATATEILNDLAVFQGTRAGSVTLPPSVRFSSSQMSRYWKWLVGAAAILLIVLGGFWYRARSGSSGSDKAAVTGPSISLAILPFANGSGDQSLDWLGSSLADMLSTDVGQSAHVRAVSPDRLHQIMHDLQISPDSFSDAATVKRLADMSNADTIVWGKYAKFGEQFRVDATLRDIRHDHDVSFKVEAANQQDLLQKVDGLAQTIRDNLALKPNIANELKAQSFKPSSNSVDAIRLFSEGTNLSRQGKNLEAVKDFESATQADPNFALAYAKLGQTFANLGHDAEAEQASRKAVQLSDNLPPREKYLIAANDARIQRDYPKAIQSYENLATSSPDDPEIQFELGRLYEDSGAADKARDRYSKVLAGDPNNVGALLALGRLELRHSNPQGALDYFNRALPLSVQFGNDEAKGTILQGIGVSYRQLDKQDEALTYFKQALDVRQRLGDKRGVGVTLNVMAQIEENSGKSQQAQKDYEGALKVRQEIGDKGGMAGTLLDLGGFHLDLGHYDQALGLFKQALQAERDLGDESSQGLCLNNIGLTYLSKADYDNALTYFQQALTLRQKSQVPGDIALTLHNVAVTYEDLGQYDQALANFEHALDLYRTSDDKRGVAMESYAMGMLFGYQGRFGAALNLKQQALKIFTDLQDKTYWMTEVSSGYGESLADAGRFDEAQKPLADALSLARNLKIDGSIAQALDFQGELLFYRGDLKGAADLYNQALPFASRSKEQEEVLLTRFHLAQIALKQGHSAEAATSFKKIAADADTLGAKYLGFAASVSLGEDFLQSKNYDRAQQELEHAIAGAEKLQLRAVLAQAHYLLATTLRLRGRQADAANHYGQVLQYLDQIRKDVGNDTFLQRSDLKLIDSESRRYTQPAKTSQVTQ